MKLRTIIKRLSSYFLYDFYLLKSKKLSIKEKNNLLVIAPHPDDESFACGALIAKYKEKGHSVNIIIVTDGRASSPKEAISQKNLITIRHNETLNAIKKLGCKDKDIIFLNYEDSRTSNYKNKIEQNLIHYIKKLNPSLIASPFLLDKHNDHATIASIVEKLQSDKSIISDVIYYPLWFWPKIALSTIFSKKYKTYKLNASPYLKIKEEAILAHKSQFENITGSKKWGYLDPHIINMQLKPYELYFKLSDKK